MAQPESYQLVIDGELIDISATYASSMTAQATRHLAFAAYPVLTDKVYVCTRVIIEDPWELVEAIAAPGRSAVRQAEVRDFRTGCIRYCLSTGEFLRSSEWIIPPPPYKPSSQSPVAREPRSEAAESVKRAQPTIARLRGDLDTARKDHATSLADHKRQMALVEQRCEELRLRADEMKEQYDLILSQHEGVQRELKDVREEAGRNTEDAKRTVGRLTDELSGMRRQVLSIEAALAREADAHSVSRTELSDAKAWLVRLRAKVHDLYEVSANVSAAFRAFLPSDISDQQLIQDFFRDIVKLHSELEAENFGDDSHAGLTREALHECAEEARKSVVQLLRNILAGQTDLTDHDLSTLRLGGGELQEVVQSLRTLMDTTGASAMMAVSIQNVSF